MEFEFGHIHKKIAHGKYSLFAITGFLALLTYLTIIVAQGVSNEQASIDTRSQAAVRIGDVEYRNGIRLGGARLNEGSLTNLQRGQQDGDLPGQAFVGIQTTPTPLPIVGCGQTCFDQSTTFGKEVGVCGPGLTCQQNPVAGGYMDSRRCYPEGQYGSCKTKACQAECSVDGDCMGAMKCLGGKCTEHYDCTSFCSVSCTDQCKNSTNIPGCEYSCNIERQNRRCNEPAPMTGIDPYKMCGNLQIRGKASPGCCVNTQEGEHCTPLIQRN